MAIATNALIDFFGDTQDTVTAGGGTSAVVSGAFSVDADSVDWTNDDDAPLGAFVLTTAAGQTAFTAGDHVELYARLMNIDGTADQPIPDASYPHIFIGSFFVDAVSGAQSVPLAAGAAALANQYSSQVYRFYVKSEATPSLAAGWVVKVTPVTQGPHPAV